MYETGSPDVAPIPQPAPRGAGLGAAGLDPSLTYDTVEVDGAAVVTLRGDLDLASAPELLRQLQSLVARPVTSVTVDLAGLAFLDSSGLGTLCRAQQEAEGRGIAFALDRVPSHARRVLEITGLSRQFHLA